MDQDTNLIGAFNEKQFVITETSLVTPTPEKVANRRKHKNEGEFQSMFKLSLCNLKIN